MKMSQTIAKLARTTGVGWNPALLIFENLPSKLLLETSGRWISERVSFNSRRVMLMATPISYFVIKIEQDTLRHILYSEQKNINRGEIYLYDYTILDETDSAQTVTITTTPAASGMGTSKVETLSTEFPIHMVRFGAGRSEALDHQEFTRLYAFIPGDTTANDDMELDISGTRYTITESVTELLCIRLSLTER